jgi:hypothetical protein
MKKNCALGWLFTEIIKMAILTFSTGFIRKTILVLFFFQTPGNTRLTAQYHVTNCLNIHNIINCFAVKGTQAE